MKKRSVNYGIYLQKKCIISDAGSTKTARSCPLANLFDAERQGQTSNFFCELYINLLGLLR